MRNRFTPITLGLICINVTIYLLFSFLPLDSQMGILYAIGISRSGFLDDLFFWQPISYLFLHNSLIILIFNMLALFGTGPELERVLGWRNFLILFILSGMSAALLALFLEKPNFPVTIGVAGPIMGFLGAYTVLYPGAIFMIFFIIPISIRVLSIGLLTISAIFLIFGWLPIISFSVLIGGFAGGYLYTKIISATRRKKFGTDYSSAYEIHSILSGGRSKLFTSPDSKQMNPDKLRLLLTPENFKTQRIQKSRQISNDIENSNPESNSKQNPYDTN